MSGIPSPGTDLEIVTGERDVVVYFVADLAEESTDVAVMAALGLQIASLMGLLHGFGGH